MLPLEWLKQVQKTKARKNFLKNKQTQKSNVKDDIERAGWFLMKLFFQSTKI